MYTVQVSGPINMGSSKVAYIIVGLMHTFYNDSSRTEGPQLMARNTGHVAMASDTRPQIIVQIRVSFCATHSQCQIHRFCAATPYTQFV